MSNLLYAPTVIDLSRASAPNAIDEKSPEILYQEAQARFEARWAELRANDPTLPPYDVAGSEFDSAPIVLQAWSFLRFLDRQRVNETVRAVLAPLARGADLDAVAARAGVARLVVVPADPVANRPAVYETDAQFLRRYLLSFDRPSAGSAGRYLYEAWTAWPAMQDAAVVGRAIHGRRGDTDIVIAGPGGRVPTAEELARVRVAVTQPHVQPEAVAVAVLAARRAVYDVDLTIFVPPGPDATVVGKEAGARVRAATNERTLIGSEVPLSLIEGAAHGPNVVRVVRNAPAAPIAPEPYTIPVCEGLTIRVEAYR